MRASAVLAVKEWAVTIDDIVNWSTDVAPADDAKASENDDIEKQAADVTAEADKPLADVRLLRR